MKKKIDLFELISIDLCFEIMVSADEYYRKLYSEPRGSQASWNIRDQHMTMTVIKLREQFNNILKKNPKIIVWAHNSHIGDSTATSKGGKNFNNNNTWNLGQMIRNTFGKDKVKIVGFYTYQGFVRASPQWDTPSKKYTLKKAIDYSYEWFFHKVATVTQIDNFFINFNLLDRNDVNPIFNLHKLPYKYKFLNTFFYRLNTIFA